MSDIPESVKESKKKWKREKTYNFAVDLNWRYFTPEIRWLRANPEGRATWIKRKVREDLGSKASE